MLSEERRSIILKIVEEKGSASIKEISSLVNVSPMTVRRDLSQLASQGDLIKTYGGALSPRLEEPFYAVKTRLNVTDKQRIGAEAARLVRDGETVMLDSGSTTFHVALQLKMHRSLTIVTTDLVIAWELSKEPQLSVLFVGGAVRPRIFSTVGPYAEEMLRQLSVDKVFLGTDALSLEKGLLNSNLEEVPIKRLMIQAAREVILVADHSKLEKNGLGFVCGLDSLDTLVTDKSIPPSTVEALENRGIRVVLA